MVAMAPDPKLNTVVVLPVRSTASMRLTMFLRGRGVSDARNCKETSEGRLRT